jgi:hypothetical protein
MVFSKLWLLSQHDVNRNIPYFRNFGYVNMTSIEIFHYWVNMTSIIFHIFETLAIESTRSIEIFHIFETLAGQYIHILYFETLVTYVNIFIFFISKLWLLSQHDVGYWVNMTSIQIFHIFETLAIESTWRQ